MSAAHKKKKELDRKRRYALDHDSAQVLPPNVAILRDPPGAAKMSKVLEDFLEPYWDDATSAEQYEKLLNLGVAAWNAALMPPAEREALIQEGEKTMEPGVLRAVLEPMIQRKFDHFADNRRQILGFHLTMQPTGPYLEVVSTLPEGHLSILGRWKAWASSWFW